MMYIGDIEGFYEAMNCDCLGCLMDAVASGAISDEDMHEIISEQNADEMQTTPCPQCGKPAYVSMYEPSVAHCPSCGMYSALTPMSGVWMPFRQGAVMR